MKQHNAIMSGVMPHYDSFQGGTKPNSMLNLRETRPAIGSRILRR